MEMMANGDGGPRWTTEVPVTEQSQVGQARREAQAIAQAAGFSESDVARAALVATELATNIVKHAGRGTLVLTRGHGSLDVLALDHGGGIGNFARALEDGYSTAGSPGTGLGAVQRQSEIVETFSSAPWGTAILARIVAGRQRSRQQRVAVLSVPYPGETRNGDGWAMREIDGGVLVAVIDGLGHGALASDASFAARDAFAQSAESEPAAVMRRLHQACRATRGAAIAVASIHRVRNEVVFAGVGNVAAAILTAGARRSAVSMYGIVGHELRDIREFRYDCPAGAVFVMHSDGISAKWDIDQHPGLAMRDPALIAGVIWRDHRRTSDDATLLVTRA